MNRPANLPDSVDSTDPGMPWNAEIIEGDCDECGQSLDECDCGAQEEDFERFEE